MVSIYLSFYRIGPYTVPYTKAISLAVFSVISLTSTLIDTKVLRKCGIQIMREIEI